MKVLLAHPGTQHSFHLAKQLEKAGLLYRFYTGLAISNNSFKARLVDLLPPIISKKVRNRIIDGIPPDKIRTLPLLEYQIIRDMRNAANPEDVIYKRNLKFQQSIPDSAIKESDVVIGFDTSSWILAERSKAFGKLFILDVSIGHPASKEKIYKELSVAYPEWKEQMAPKRRAFIALEGREMELADLVIVPSGFVKHTLEENGIPSDKIKLNPFGTITDQFKFTPGKKITRDEIVFLFMGSLSSRKGLPFLLEAWNEMNIPKAKLIIAGYGKIPDGIKLPGNIINKGVIAKDERQALFDSANVFLFPSFFEGLAQVQIEAMACGLPVVGTTNSGAIELVNEGVNGFTIEAGNKMQLKKAIQFFLDHPEKIEEMAIAARKKIEEFSWDDYGGRWREILEKTKKN
ncbi:MAG: glycosyltransferase family 4 protein [Ferruginibacter sp.]